MKIFKGRGSGGERFLDPSNLCPTCRKAFEACFKKDEEGKLDLDFSHAPKLCESCKKKMKEKFRSSMYPDRS